MLETLSVGNPIIVSNIRWLPEIMGTVDRELIFDDLDTIEEFLLDFSKGNFHRTKQNTFMRKSHLPRVIGKYIQVIWSI
jgi:hypothetical protein